MDGQTEQEKREAEELKQKSIEMQEKIKQGINSAMSSAAENLEKTADTIHKTAGFFREKNADTLGNDVSSLVKKYPGATLAGAIVLGFLFGKVLSK